MLFGKTRKLSGLGQDMGDSIGVFLRDKYPVNRMLAFQYLLDAGMDGIYDIAIKLLLDKSAAVRETAQHVIQKKTIIMS